jgi:hypothetical protein
MSKAQGSPILKFGIIALAILAVVFLLSRMMGGDDTEELGEVPAPKYDPVSPLDPQNVIGGGDPGGPSPVKK